MGNYFYFPSLLRGRKLSGLVLNPHLGDKTCGCNRLIVLDHSQASAGEGSAYECCNPFHWAREALPGKSACTREKEEWRCGGGGEVISAHVGWIGGNRDRA
jgi:hypothetical protein